MEALKSKLKSIRAELLKFIDEAGAASASGGFTYEISDGTKLYAANELAVGTTVYVVDQDNAKLPASAGTYEVNGVGTIVVGEGGVVQELSMNQGGANATSKEPLPASLEAVEISPELMQQIANTVFDMVMAKMAESEDESEVEEMGKKVDGMYNAQKALNEKFNGIAGVVGQLAQTLEEYGNEPKPAKAQTIVKMSAEDSATALEAKAQRLAETIKQIKNQK
jgi:hypothetical protein